MIQASQLVMLIRPTFFRPNPQAANDNSYIVQLGDPESLAGLAKQQHRNLCELLALHRVRTVVLEGTSGELPSELFLNNWFSTHDDARGKKIAVIYPMRWENRRAERRADIIAVLVRYYDEVLDLSNYESDGKYLEATGSLVFDRKLKRVYAARSQRTHDQLVKHVADRLGYESVVFDTIGLGDKPIYHTNVMMYLGTDMGAICLDAIVPRQREMVASKVATDRVIVTLTQAQIKEFAGNGLEVADEFGQVILIMSERAYKSFTRAQLDVLNKYYGCRILSLPFAAIEQGGGSVRCTLAALYTDDPIALAKSLSFLNEGTLVNLGD